MATLSASVSVFKIPTALNPKPHDLLRHFKPPNPNPKSSNKPTPTFTAHGTNTSVNPPPTLITPKQPLINPRSHHNPSTGYAAALLDAARSHRALESVNRDVRRLSTWLRRRRAEAEVSRDALREVAKRGKLHKYLSRLVRLLVEKSSSDRGAAEMVSQALVEFGRIHDELLTTGGGSDRVVVLVSPGARMQIQEIARVAEKVQKISGAAVVTVRQLLARPRFAV